MRAIFKWWVVAVILAGLVFGCSFAGWASDGVALQGALELWRQGKMKEAAAVAKKVLVAQPGDADAWNEYGVMCLGLGEKAEAEKAFARALVLKPGHSHAALNLANFLCHQGRFSEALAQFNTALAWHSRDSRLLTGRAQMYAQYGHYAEALADLVRACAISPRNPFVLNELAWLLATCPEAGIRNGATAMRLAMDALEEVAGVMPDLIDTLAAVQAENGNFDEAALIQKKLVQWGVENNLPDELLAAWREREGLYRLQTPYRQTPGP